MPVLCWGLRASLSFPRVLTPDASPRFAQRPRHSAVRTAAPVLGRSRPGHGGGRDRPACVEGVGLRAECRVWLLLPLPSDALLWVGPQLTEL